MAIGKRFKLHRVIYLAFSTAAICFIAMFFTHSSPGWPQSRENVVMEKRRHRASLYKTLSKDHFLASTRTNVVHKESSSACVVDPAVTECSEFGFAAFLLLTLEHVSLCRSLGSSNVTIFWKGCNSGCSKDTGFNSWEWYFEPVNPGTETNSINVICIVFAFIDGLIEQSDLLNWSSVKPILNSSFRNRSSVPGFERSHIIRFQDRYRVNNLITTYVKPNTRILKKVDDFYQSNMAQYNLLGVHVRGTDIWFETTEQKLPAIMSWINHAARIFDSISEPKKIFLASDNHESVNKFVAYFGEEKVTSIDAFRADFYNGADSVQDLANSQHVDQRELGTQVLMDILLLAKCDYLLHTESSVTALATYFNPYLKSHFLEECPPGDQALRDDEDNDEKEESPQETEFSELAKCFQRNSPTNACPNTAKGNFVNFAQAKRFLKL